MVYKDQHFSDSSRLSIPQFDLRPFRAILRRFIRFYAYNIIKSIITP
nr:MAG TPA: hypothetical protein [Crassvirales sp.]